MCVCFPSRCGRESLTAHRTRGAEPALGTLFDGDQPVKGVAELALGFDVGFACIALRVDKRKRERWNVCSCRALLLLRIISHVLGMFCLE